jgi:hypothetical protein
MHARRVPVFAALDVLSLNGNDMRTEALRASTRRRSVARN